MRLITPFLLALVFLIVSCQPVESPATEQAAEPEMSQAEIKAVIQGLEDTLAMAYNTKDVELFSRFYAEDAVTYGEGREQLFGKKALVGHFRTTSMKDTSGRQFEYLTIDVFHHGDLAVENGKWIQKNAEGTELDHGFYMVVFKKQNGQWRSIRDMWNSSTLD